MDDDGLLPLFASSVSELDRAASLPHMHKLVRLVATHRRDLVFFVGAGASMAGDTGMPSTTDLLQSLVAAGLCRSAAFDRPMAERMLAGVNAGFEMTLNDLWQISPTAVDGFFRAFAAADESFSPNHVHWFLAWWLATGGVVITTNYDRLIERALGADRRRVRVRYAASTAPSDPGSDVGFSMWQQDLAAGGCLFKLHGSFDSTASCLGALEHVTTRLSGERAALVEYVIANRPVCFVGWRGADPDIPSFTASIAETYRSTANAFWIHSHSSRGTLDDKVSKTPISVRWLAERHPIRTDAEVMCSGLLRLLGIQVAPSAAGVAVSPDFAAAMNTCSPSGVLRFAGIVLRRARKFPEAVESLRAADLAAQTDGERAATRQELAHLYWTRGARNHCDALQIMREIATTVRSADDLDLRTTHQFGYYSMAVNELLDWLEGPPADVTDEALNQRLAEVDRVAQDYDRYITQWQEHAVDQRPIALHRALLSLFAGRLRLGVFEVRPDTGPFDQDQVVAPFLSARRLIDNAGDIHIHSRIDVLSYTALALAHFGRCMEAWRDVAEIERLCDVLSDQARVEHWSQVQRPKLEHLCPAGVMSRCD